MSLVAPNILMIRKLSGGGAPPILPNTLLYQYLASCISITLAMLHDPGYIEALEGLALRYDATMARSSQSSQTPWAPWYGGIHGEPDLASHMVEGFLQEIRTVFPVLVVDDNLINRDLLGYHSRRQWTNVFNDADSPLLSQKQLVHLNGPLVDKMLASSNNGARFRAFQFLFANTLAHEVGGHVLITYLGQGGSHHHTPSDLGADLDRYDYDNNHGESGRWLECATHEGSLDYYRDHEADDDQPGVPYIVTSNDDVYRIPQATIDATVSYNFKFPYVTLEDADRPGETLGKYDPVQRDILDSTRNRAWLARQVPGGLSIRMDKDATVRRIPFHPEARVQPA